MDTLALPGDPVINIALRRSKRARRISLRVAERDGSVTLTLPTWAPEAEAQAFAAEKEGWIRRALARRRPTEVVRIGDTVPVAGQALPVVAVPKGPARIQDGQILIQDSPSRFAPRLIALLKETARARLVAEADRQSAALGRPYGRITLRDTKSRWGSCSSRGDLMFSWRLIMAPPEVLDYVVAHEVAHLQEMNHSPAFWAVVAQLYPAYEAPRRWLRHEGSALLRLQFGD